MISSVSDYFDSIIVVNDGSSDKTEEIVIINNGSRIVLVSHSSNLGVGGTIASGNQIFIKEELDIVVILASDNQIQKGIPSI
ncbi:hypothetical protein CEE45_02755 [Candidatus Heimdallarchaeota archaeon B3_Heim]|nr:MAG: hypothetical protein CEE45_02755 [Candidatus Heimdallarchaeota archaeon B3_Heim]